MERYTPHNGHKSAPTMEIDEKGQWVKFSDMLQIVRASLPALKHAITLAEIATRSRKSADPAYYAKRIKELETAKALYADALKIIS